MNSTCWRYAAVLLVAAMAASMGPVYPAHAGLTVLVAARDNTLIESPSGESSNGAGPAIFAGRTSQSVNSIRRALLAFDVAGAIPAGAIIDSVMLELELTPSNDAPAILSLHRVLREWGEGTSSSGGGGGAPATTDDVTWIHSFYDSEFWEQPGGDFEATASAETEVGPPGRYYWGSTPGMVADVQSWLDDPTSEHGWILIGNEQVPTTAKRFESRESSNVAGRPRLVVEFSLTCEAAGLRGPAWGLCHAYCEALGCDGEQPRASGRACERIARNFERRTGGEVFPCER